MVPSSIASDSLAVTIEGAGEAASSSKRHEWVRLVEELLEESAIPSIGTTPRAFTRKGKLSPPVLITALLVMVSDGHRGGYATVLEDLWADAGRAGIDLGCAVAPSAEALCSARKRLQPQALRLVLHTLARRIESRTSPGPAGRRFYGVDGSKFNTRRSKKLWKFAGRPDRGAGAPQVTASVLFDLYSKHPVDVRMGRNRASERDLCIRHLDCLKKGDVVVLDRGYPSYDMFRAVLSRGLDFVIRCPSSSTFPAIATFLASGALDAEIEIEPPSRIRRIKKRRARNPNVRLRAVRLPGPDGQDSVVLTTLSRDDLSRDDIIAIYRSRWNVEEYYKLSKDQYFGLGQMHAKSPAGVEQELLAQAIYVAIMRWIAASLTAEAPACADPRLAAPSANAERAPASPGVGTSATGSAAPAAQPVADTGPGDDAPQAAAAPAAQPVAPRRSPRTDPHAETLPRGREIQVRNALHALSRILVIVLLGTPEAVEHHLTQLRRMMVRRAIRPRPGRHFPRRSYAPQSKWVKGGRKGKQR